LSSLAMPQSSGKGLMGIRLKGMKNGACINVHYCAGFFQHTPPSVA
jgi:hypothetical protein